jgi:branched-chain amino acid transport system substrate-binding protein
LPFPRVGPTTISKTNATFSGKPAVMRLFPRRLLEILPILLILAAFGPFSPVQAEETRPIKIGMMVTLSGSSSVLGTQTRDGFALALKELGGRLGGREVELIVVDDELKPDLAVQKLKTLLERDQVELMVGPIFSNILQAIHRPVIESGRILISPNAGPSIYAGAQCSPYFSVVSYQNDQAHEVMGRYADSKAYKRVAVIMPNYQAGKDAVAGFRRAFSGEISDEIYVPMTQLDLSGELARLNAGKPDAVFTFMPGGMGVALVKQYAQAGLSAKIPFLSTFTFDEATLPAQQEAALGLIGSTSWSPSLDNPANRAFVRAFEASYQSVPSAYAMQGYDTAMLIHSALKQTQGDTKNRDQLARAIRKADFTSLRGQFRFNVNGYPIQDFYQVRAIKRSDGKFQTEIVDKILSDYGDTYAKDCKNILP